MMKKLALVVCCLFVVACGFRPLYQNTNTLAGDYTVLDTIALAPMGGATGQQLKNALIDRFYSHGYPDNARYVLTVSIQELSRSIAIQKNDTTSRAQLVLRAIYSLQDKGSGIVMDSGDIRAVSSYDILQSQYTTVVTLSQARENAIKELADKLTTRMAVVLEEGKGSNAANIAPVTTPQRESVFSQGDPVSAVSQQ